MNAFFKLTNTITAKISKPISLLVFIIMCNTTIEVISRYFFNRPTIWVWPINKQLFGIFILFAGAYTMLRGQHIRIEILYEHFSPKLRSIARVFAIIAMITFLGVLIWQGSWMGLNALKAGQKASGAFTIPLYPLKLLIPLCVSLFLLQGISVFFRGNKED